MSYGRFHWLWQTIVAFCITGVSLADDLSQIIDKARPSLVYITACPPAPANCVEKGKTGTGFVVSSAGFLPTASHVIPDTTWLISGKLKSSAGAETHELQLIARDPQFDVVLLKFADTSLQLTPLAIGNPFLVRDGAELFTMGFGKNVEFGAKSGPKSGSGGGGGTWLADLRLNPGDSGSPVFNDQAEVVAIVVSELKLAEGIKFLLPISFAAYVLNAAGVTVPTSPTVSASTNSGSLYTIHGSISGTYEQYEPWSQKFTHGNVGKDCDDTFDDTQRFCAPPGFFLDVHNVGSLSPESANCNSSIGTIQVAGPSCITVPARVAGCGYDNIAFGIRNCKGRGWISYAVSLNARKPVETAIPAYEVRVSPSSDQKGVVEFRHPSVDKNLPGRKWVYTLAVEFRSGNQIKKAVRVSNLEPFVDGVATKMTDGVLLVTILSEHLRSR